MKVNKVLDIRHSHDCGHVHHQKFTIYVYIYFALALTVPKRTHKQTNTIKHIQQRPNRRHTVCVCVCSFSQVIIAIIIIRKYGVWYDMSYPVLLYVSRVSIGFSTLWWWLGMPPIHGHWYQQWFCGLEISWSTHVFRSSHHHCNERVNGYNLFGVLSEQQVSGMTKSMSLLRYDVVCGHTQREILGAIERHLSFIHLQFMQSALIGIY